MKRIFIGLLLAPIFRNPNRPQHGQPQCRDSNRCAEPVADVLFTSGKIDEIRIIGSESREPVLMRISLSTKRKARMCCKRRMEVRLLLIS